VIHCTGTTQTATIESIKKYWKEVLKWNDVGYHYIIPPSGIEEQLLDITKVSNGVKNHNHDSLNISYIGGVDSDGNIVDNRTNQQKETLQRLVEQFSIQFPKAVIKGHRDFSTDKNKNGRIEPQEWMKACPSFEVKDWLNEIGFKSKAEANFKTVTATALNIRDGAGTEFKSITVVPKGTRLKQLTDILSVSANKEAWCYVSVVGTDIVGYAISQYLK